MNIPKTIQVGGITYEVKELDEIKDGKLGECNLVESTIFIAKKANGYVQSEENKLNTFFHECVHVILDTMGEYDISSNEKFVRTFSSFATEIYKSTLRNK